MGRSRRPGRGLPGWHSEGAGCFPGTWVSGSSQASASHNPSSPGPGAADSPRGTTRPPLGLALGSPGRAHRPQAAVVSWRGPGSRATLRPSRPPLAVGLSSRVQVLLLLLGHGHLPRGLEAGGARPVPERRAWAGSEGGRGQAMGSLAPAPPRGSTALALRARPSGPDQRPPVGLTEGPPRLGGPVDLGVSEPCPRREAEPLLMSRSRPGSGCWGPPAEPKDGQG